MKSINQRVLQFSSSWGREPWINWNRNIKSIKGCRNWKSRNKTWKLRRGRRSSRITLGWRENQKKQKKCCKRYQEKTRKRLKRSMKGLISYLKGSYMHRWCWRIQTISLWENLPWKETRDSKTSKEMRSGILLSKKSISMRISMISWTASQTMNSQSSFRRETFPLISWMIRVEPQNWHNST